MKRQRSFYQSKQILTYTLVIFTLNIIYGCSLESKYPLQDFYLIEGSWKYQHQPGNQTWQITRRVLDKKEKDNFTWYKVQTETQYWDGKSYSETKWYSLQGKVIYVREGESGIGTFAFGLPGQGESKEEKNGTDGSRTTYERSISVIETNDNNIDDPFETDTSKLPCPCLGLLTFEIYTQGGSFSGSTQEMVWYARNIGVVLMEKDSINPKKDILIEFNIGNTRL